MGNGCFCKSSSYIKDINLESFPKHPITNSKSEIMNQKDEEELVEKDKLNNVQNYFKESQKELFNSFNSIKKKDKDKEKSKKNKEQRKSSKKFDLLMDINRYEVMIGRLLAQKSIKRYGPKRRETIRKDANISIIVNELIKENNNINKEEKKMMEEKGSIIIKNTKNLKIRNSLIIDRKEMLKNGI